ncbi:MAG: hypothetical protein ABW215_07885, partial [Kibdelosporangium sp.]
MDDGFHVHLTALTRLAETFAGRQRVVADLGGPPQHSAGAFALDRHSLPHVLDAVRETVRRGIQRLADGPRPAFDLAWQLAGLIAAMTTVDEPGAVALGMQLAGRDSATRTIVGLA